MGLLDDAIREHLELKRRHGADPSEVARQEREALGPIQRQPAEADAAATDPASAGAVPEVDVPTPGPVAPPPEPEAIPEPPVSEAPLPPADAPPPPAEPREPAGAVRYDPDDDVQWSDPPRDPEPTAEAGDAEEEDVLEETPEFLQETPEHDRLWFEQRPPRDFDF